MKAKNYQIAKIQPFVAYKSVAYKKKRVDEYVLFKLKEASPLTSIIRNSHRYLQYSYCILSYKFLM